MQLCSSCSCFKLCSQTVTVKFCEFRLEINNTIKYRSSSVITHMSIITHTVEVFCTLIINLHKQMRAGTFFLLHSLYFLYPMRAAAFYFI